MVLAVELAPVLVMLVVKDCSNHGRGKGKDHHVLDQSSWAALCLLWLWQKQWCLRRETHPETWSDPAWQLISVELNNSITNTHSIRNILLSQRACCWGELGLNQCTSNQSWFWSVDLSSTKQIWRHTYAETKYWKQLHTAESVSLKRLCSEISWVITASQGK